MGTRGLLALILALIIVLFACAPTTAAAGAQDGDEGEGLQFNRTAVLETDYGVITFVLYENLTPITTSNFIALAESGHYDGVLFHRIVDDFVIQTGDGGGTGDPIPLEIHPNATHVDGAVGMARSEDPDSAEDQFYICDGPQHGLDGDYAVFGLVLEGIEVVRQIAEVPVYGENNPRPGEVAPLLWKNVGMPKEDVYLQKVSIIGPEVEDQRSLPVMDEAVSISAWAMLYLIIPILIIAWLLLRYKRRFANG